MQVRMAAIIAKFYFYPFIEALSIFAAPTEAFIKSSGTLNHKNYALHDYLLTLMSAQWQQPSYFLNS